LPDRSKSFPSSVMSWIQNTIISVYLRLSAAKYTVVFSDILGV
jgi:hypothetical protein